MGRHGAQQSPPRRRAPFAVIGLMVLLLAAVGLGIWWWSLGSHRDPIDASPVLGYAVVVSSPGCDSPAADTVVDLLDVTPAVRATINACGRAQDERIAVDYLAGNPSQARVAGTSTAGTSTTGRWLPLAILAAGVLAVGAAIVLLADRRRSRQITTSRRVSVAELRRAVLDGAPNPATERG